MVVVSPSRNDELTNCMTFGEEVKKGRLRIRYVMPSTHLSLREEDVVRLALEFLHTRELHISQLSLERETGVINGNFADDVLFLRQLILDGQWDDVLEFIQPLSALESFEAAKFSYAILRHKYIELLCIKSEIKAYNNVDNVVDEVVKVLNELEKVAPSKEEYSNLCLLLTLPSITDHSQFKNWNPSNARVQCFREIYPLVEQFLPSDKKGGSAASSKCSKNDRLIQLLIKGILYESCVNYCQAKATGSEESQNSDVSFSRLLDGSGFDESDLSLLSWLQSIPAETFGVPFEQRILNVDVERLERPSLHASWTEHIFVSPIKPRMFPHLAMPFRRPRSAADAMTRSLRPHPDGAGAPRHPAVMALSAIDFGPSAYSSCFASFHLTGIKSGKAMNTSVDRLFEKENDWEQNGSLDFGVLKPIGENAATGGKPAAAGSAATQTSTASSPEHRGRESPASVSASTARSSRRDSLSDRAGAPPPPAQPAANAAAPGDFRRDLLKEYQLQKQRECDDYLRQLCSQDPRFLESSAEPPHPEPAPDVRQQQGPHDAAAAFNGTPAPAVPVSPNINRSAQSTQDNDEAYDAVGASRLLGIPASPPAKDLVHPSDFPSTLRRDGLSTSTLSLRRDTPSPTARLNRNSVGSFSNLRRNSINSVNYNRRDSISIVNPIRDMKRDYVGSTGCLAKKDLGYRKISMDSLDSRRNSWDPGRRGSVYSDMEDSIHEDRNILKSKPLSRNLTRSQGNSGAADVSVSSNGPVNGRPTFRAVTVLEDLQAVRCAEFHPNGKLYAVGSNTKTLRVCAYPKIDNVTENHEPFPPSVLFKRTKHHKGSIYCLAWSPDGDLLATGSNDKTVKLMRFNSETSNLEGQEVELTMHDGTVRDVCFIEDSSNKTSLLVSAGAGDCKIYVTDCVTAKPFVALSGHSGHVLSLYNWGGAMFASGSQDKTVRFWDLRTGGCINVISSANVSGNRQGSAVASVAVDPSGRLLVCGHEDASCMLYDVRGGRMLQRFAPHASDVRSVRFSPGAYYLLTAGYDGKLMLTDLQGDLTMTLPSVVVARHPDKVISGRWHPQDFSFLSTSADKTCALWTIPPI